MENKYIPPEDLSGKLGSKKDLYDILTIDRNQSLFNTLCSGFLPTTIRKMFNRIHEGDPCRKKEGKTSELSPAISFRHCRQNKCRWYRFQDTESWEWNPSGTSWRKQKTSFHIFRHLKKDLFLKDRSYGEY